jgi:hypothetical protein
MNQRIGSIVAGTMAIVLVISYSTYFPYTENNVVVLFSTLHKYNTSTIVCTPRAKRDITSFVSLTDSCLTNRIECTESEGDFEPGQTIFVSRVFRRIGIDRTSPEEQLTIKLLNEGKIKLFTKVPGYNIYNIVAQ